MTGGALARCVGDVEAFRAGHWGVAPLRRRGGDGAFDDLLSLADVDHIIATTAPRRPAIRLVRGGTPVDAARYTRSAQVSGERIHGLIDPGRVYDLVAAGATVVLQALQRWWAPLARFCRDLELALTHPVQANAYLTPAGAAGLAAHHDTHDVFVLQVHGGKAWMVHEPLVEAPLPRHRTGPAAAAQPVLFEADLGPGDSLYLPRGFIHSARAQEAVSLHVTVGVLAYTGADVLDELVRRAVDEEPALRRSLALGVAADDRAMTDAVATCAAALQAWAGRADAGAVADTLSRRFWSSRAPLLEGQLGQLARLDAIDDATTVRRRPGAVSRLEPAGAKVRLLLGDRRLVVPAAVAPAVARLVAGSPVRVGDLADLLDGASRLVLVRRLVREGALVAVDGE